MPMMGAELISFCRFMNLVFLCFSCFFDHALIELVNHNANRTLFLVLRISPNSRA